MEYDSSENAIVPTRPTRKSSSWSRKMKLKRAEPQLMLDSVQVSNQIILPKM